MQITGSLNYVIVLHYRSKWRRSAAETHSSISITVYLSLTPLGYAVIGQCGLILKLQSFDN